VSYNNFKVFISSKDVSEDERTTVVSALEKLKISGLRIESNKWVATSNSTEYLHQLSESDLIILIIDLAVDTSNEDDTYYTYVKKEIELTLKDDKSVLAFFKRREKNTTSPVSKSVSNIQFKFFHSEFNNCVQLFDLVRESVQYELVKNINKHQRY